MELVFEATDNKYQDAFMFSLIDASRGDVIVVGNPFKESDTLKGKCEAMKHKCSALEKDLDELQKKVKVVDSFQEDTDTYGSNSALVVWITELVAILK